MNSLPAKPNNEQLLTKLSQMEKGLMEAAAYINQLQRIVWLTVQAAGGKVKISEGSIPTNWRLDKIREESGELCLTSNIQAPPTEEDLGRLIDKLRGTQTLIEDVQKELTLEAWPPQYLAFLISHRLAIMDGKWLDADIARQIAKGAGQN